MEQECVEKQKEARVFEKSGNWRTVRTGRPLLLETRIKFLTMIC